MVAFLPHPQLLLIFDISKTVCQSWWQLFFFIVAADQEQCQTVHQSQQRLPSAILGALCPSSAGFMSVQTSSASATYARTFFCLQHQVWGLQWVCSEWVAFLPSKSMCDCWVSDIKWHQVPSLQLWWNERSREWAIIVAREWNQKATQWGCIWDWPTLRGQASVCVEIKSASKGVPALKKKTQGRFFC